MHRLQVVRPYIDPDVARDRWARAADLGWDNSDMAVSTSTATVTTVTDHLRRAAVRATWAHSAYDTQPWCLRLEPTALRLKLDRTRQLHVADPSRRLMIMSLGCALLNARVSLAVGDLAVSVERIPARTDRDVVAVIRTGGDAPVPALARLGEALQARHFDSHLFLDAAVPRDVIGGWQRAVAQEGPSLRFLASAKDRRAVLGLLTHAEAIQTLNPAYRAELRAWNHGADQAGWVPAADGATSTSLALICTAGDDADHWLAAGEALERTLLEATLAGYAAQVLWQVTEVPSVRSQLRRDLALSGHPQVLLRFGRAPSAPTPTRRRLVDVLAEPDRR